MSDYAQWLSANDQYLADALADIRARLQHAAERQGELVATSAAPDTPVRLPAAAAEPVARMPAIVPVAPKHASCAH